MEAGSGLASCSCVFVINGDSMGARTKELLRDLQISLPDCQFKTTPKQPRLIVPRQYEPSNVLLVLNCTDGDRELEQMIGRFDAQQRKYVVYPKSLPSCKGYKASTPQELVRCLSQLLIQSASIQSEASISSVKRNQKLGASLHVIIAKSEDSKFRGIVKSVYKKFKQNPYVQFFQSRTLQKIHTGLFKNVLFVVNQNDVQDYIKEYQILKGKKAPSSSFITTVFATSSVIIYGFKYEQLVKTGEQFDDLVSQTLAQMMKNRFDKRHTTQQYNNAFLPTQTLILPKQQLQNATYKRYSQLPPAKHDPYQYTCHVNRASEASLPKITETNFEFSLTENNMVASGQQLKSTSSVPAMRTTELILQETKLNMNKIYKNSAERQESNHQVNRPPLSNRPSQGMRFSESNRKVSIAVGLNEYTDKYNYQQAPSPAVHQRSVEGIQLSFSEDSFSAGSREFINPKLTHQNQIQPSAARSSVKADGPKTPELENAYWSNNTPRRDSFLKQKAGNIPERRSIMRNTPQRTGFKAQSQLQRQSRLERTPSSIGAYRQQNQNYYSPRHSEDYFVGSSITSPSKLIRPKSSRISGKQAVINCLADTHSKTLSEMLERRNQSLKQESQINDVSQEQYQGELQLLFKTSSPYIDHLVHYFQAYPCSVFTYMREAQLEQLVPTLDKLALTILILDTGIIESIRLFRSFQKFNYVIACKQEDVCQFKHKFPNTVLMKEDSHKKSFRQMLSYIRYLKLRSQEHRVSDREILPHLSALQPMTIYSPVQPLIQDFVAQNLPGYKLISYNDSTDLINILQSNLFGKAQSYDVMILRNPEEKVVTYLSSSVFGVKKILVYNNERDLPQLQEQLCRLNR